MILYQSGNYVVGNISQKYYPLINVFENKPRLISYFYAQPGGLVQHLFYIEVMEKNIQLFLDSGAFSAKTRGVSIDIYDYIDFIKQYEDKIDVYANLDDIDNPDNSLKNLQIMEEAGLHPLPVFHYGENPDKYLKPLVEKYDFIGIGGMVRVPNVTNFLDYLFTNYICDEKGYPKIKVHGFGMTRINLMWRYPWYSVDSTSWVLQARMGNLIVPKYVNGSFDYHDAMVIGVSSRSPKVKQLAKHLFTLPDKEKKFLIDYINQMGFKVGKSYFRKISQDTKVDGQNIRWAERKPKSKREKRLAEFIKESGVSNNYPQRDLFNVKYYEDLISHMPEYPTRFKFTGLNMLF